MNLSLTYGKLFFSIKTATYRALLQLKNKIL